MGGSRGCHPRGRRYHQPLGRSFYWRQERDSSSRPAKQVIKTKTNHVSNRSTDSHPQPPVTQREHSRRAHTRTVRRVRDTPAPPHHSATLSTKTYPVGSIPLAHVRHATPPNQRCALFRQKAAQPPVRTMPPLPTKLTVPNRVWAAPPRHHSKNTPREGDTTTGRRGATVASTRAEQGSPPAAPAACAPSGHARREATASAVPAPAPTPRSPPSTTARRRAECGSRNDAAAVRHTGVPLRPRRRGTPPAWGGQPAGRPAAPDGRRRRAAARQRMGRGGHPGGVRLVSLGAPTAGGEGA